MPMKEDCERLVRHHLECGFQTHVYSFGFLLDLFVHASDTLKNVPDVVETTGPVVVCGDVRSCFAHLLTIFQKCGRPNCTRYVFLGNYCNGGKYSLETLVLLILCQVTYPDTFFLLRGSFEHDIITKDGSFIGELRVRFPDRGEWGTLAGTVRKIFGQLPLAAVINRKMFCVNSAISAKPEPDDLCVDFKSDDDGKVRKVGIMFEPHDKKPMVVRKHLDEAAKAMKVTCKALGIGLLVHANEIIAQGYEFKHGNMVLGVFSAGGVAKTFDNRAAVMEMQADAVTRFVLIEPDVGVSKDEDAVADENVLWD